MIAGDMGDQGYEETDEGKKLDLPERLVGGTIAALFGFGIFSNIAPSSPPPPKDMLQTHINHIDTVKTINADTTARPFESGRQK